MRKLLILTVAIMIAFFGFQSCESANATNTETEIPAESTETKTPAPEKKEELTKDGLQVGDTAPDFNLKNIDGEFYSLKSLKMADGSEPKGYIVTFTCNTCPYAVANEDRLVALQNSMSAKGYPVVAINPNDPELKAGDSFEKMQERAQEKGFNFLYLFDEKQEVFPVYGATRTPEIYLLDADLVVKYTGAIDNNTMDPEGVTVKYVEDAVAALEAGNEPEPNFTRAIGCSIKVKKS